MPKKLFRALLAAFLIAAVPLQAFAALGASICRDLQHSQHDAGHGHAPSAAQSHGHGAHGDAAAVHGEDDGMPLLDAETAHCAACASCGVAAGIVAAAALPLSDAAERDVIAHAVSSFVGFVPDGLDRPPLTPLA